MKAFVIALSKRSASAASSIKVLDQLLSYGFDAKLFEGTYGHEAVQQFRNEQRTVAKYGIKREVLSIAEFSQRFPHEPVPSNAIEITVRTRITEDVARGMKKNGVLGCFYSHYRLWQQCVALDEPIFIFEDDVIFERNYIPVDWKEVLLVCVGKKAYTHQFYAPLLYEPSGPAAAIELPNTSLPGAVGYALKPAAAKKLVNTYSRDFLPADNAVNKFVVTLECHNYLMGRAAVKEDGKFSLTQNSEEVELS